MIVKEEIIKKPFNTKPIPRKEYIDYTKKNCEGEVGGCEHNPIEDHFYADIEDIEIVHK